MPAGEIGQIAVRRPDPVMFLGLLAERSCDAPEIHRRLDDHRRPGHCGCRTATSLVLRARRRCHHHASAFASAPARSRTAPDRQHRGEEIALAAAVGKPEADARTRSSKPINSAARRIFRRATNWPAEIKGFVRERAIGA